MVRQPAIGDRGDIFDVHATRALVDVYRSVRFDDDPFLDLEEGVACNIFDRVSVEQFHRSRFYNELLKLDRNNDILAMNVVFGGTYWAASSCRGASRRASSAWRKSRS